MLITFISITTASWVSYYAFKAHRYIRGILPGGGGAGLLHQIFGTQVQQAIKNKTKSELKFYKHEGSKGSKNNEIGSQLARKSRGKLI